MTLFIGVRSPFLLIFFIRTYNENTERETVSVRQRRADPDPKPVETHASPGKYSIYHWRHLGLHFDKQIDQQLSHLFEKLC